MNTRASPVASVSEPAELPLMDLEFISRHQIVEKYLAGKLPPKGVQDFERFCSRHPELLDAVGLSNHVNAALRLLEASGKPEPWSKPAPRFYERPLHFALLSTVAACLLGAAVYFAAGATTLRAQAAALQKQVTEQPLLPATITRPLVLQPNRTAPSTRPQATLNGSSGEFADLKIDVSWSTFTSFRVLIDRVGQGRFAVIGNLQRDSNGQLRLGFNATGLGPGEYQFALEGLDWRGTPQPQGWVTIDVVR
jgi:hypothetical protein